MCRLLVAADAAKFEVGDKGPRLLTASRSGVAHADKGRRRATIGFLNYSLKRERVVSRQSVT